MANNLQTNIAPKGLRTHPLFSMQKELSRLFDDLWGEDVSKSERGKPFFSPRLDAHETENEIHISAELPGMTEDEIELSIEDGYLFIKGEKKDSHEENTNGRRYVERSYGSFERVVSLPENINEDRIEANFKKGVLEITIPKQEPSKPNQKKIQVKSSS